MSRALLVALLALSACEDPITTTDLTDEGTACVEDDGSILVTFPGCLSSSCDTLTSSSCTAELVDGKVVIHAEAHISSQGNECTADCGMITASCDAPTIDDPTGVVLAYAGEEVPLDTECTFP